jgi:RNA polymerase sigma factor (sigma-70 family)
MKTPPSSFPLLIQRIGNGDDAAMCLLIRRYGSAMEQIAEQQIGPLLQSRLDASDIVQSVQMILWMGIRARKFDLPTPSHLMALTKTLVARQVAAHWRRAKTEINMTLEGNLCATMSDQKLFDPPARDADPGQQVELDETLASFLDKLEPEERRLVSLRLQGHDSTKVAKALRIDPGALRVRLFRLRAKFQDAFATMLGHEGPGFTPSDPE